jgi:hypothetical protein
MDMYELCLLLFYEAGVERTINEKQWMLRKMTFSSLIHMVEQLHEPKPHLSVPRRTTGIAK